MRALGQVRRELGALTLNARIYQGLAWRRLHTRRMLSEAQNHLPAVLSALSGMGDVLPSDAWHLHAAHWTQTGVVVLVLGSSGDRPSVALKLAPSGAASSVLRRHMEALRQLWADERLERWRDLTPEPLADGLIDRRYYVLERALPGVAGDTRLLQSDTGWDMLGAALQAIAPLHDRTATSASIDHDLLHRWSHPALSCIRTATRHSPAADRLLATLRDGLVGRVVSIGWVHGDYWAGNLLVRPDRPEVQGIVDWASAGPGYPPHLDILHLLLYARKMRQGWHELHPAVVPVLEGKGWDPREQALLERAGLLWPSDSAANRAMVLLCWLHNLAGNFFHSPRLIHDRPWIRRNVEPVLLRL